MNVFKLFSLNLSKEQDKLKHKILAYILFNVDFITINFYSLLVLLSPNITLRSILMCYEDIIVESK